MAGNNVSVPVAVCLLALLGCGEQEVESARGLAGLDGFDVQLAESQVVLAHTPSPSASLGTRKSQYGLGSSDDCVHCKRGLTEDEREIDRGRLEKQCSSEVPFNHSEDFKEHFSVLRSPGPRPSNHSKSLAWSANNETINSGASPCS